MPHSYFRHVQENQVFWNLSRELCEAAINGLFQYIDGPSSTEERWTTVCHLQLPAGISMTCSSAGLMESDETDEKSMAFEGLLHHLRNLVQIC